MKTNRRHQYPLAGLERFGYPTDALRLFSAAVAYFHRSASMRNLLLIVFGSTLMFGCGSRHEVAVTGPHSESTTNRSAVAAKAEPTVVQGDIIARIIGPSRPTANTTIPSEPNTISNFWVML